MKNRKFPKISRSYKKESNANLINWTSLYLVEWCSPQNICSPPWTCNCDLIWKKKKYTHTYMYIFADLIRLKILNQVKIILGLYRWVLRPMLSVLKRGIRGERKKTVWRQRPRLRLWATSKVQPLEPPEAGRCERVSCTAFTGCTALYILILNPGPVEMWENTFLLF